MIGAQLGSRIVGRLRGDQLRLMLAFLVLGVVIGLIWTLTIPPDQPFEVIFHMAESSIVKRIEKSKRLGASAVWMILMGLGFLTVLPVVAESRLKKSQTLEGESAPHLPSPADETPLETALSIDLVDIDTDFSGADLLLFWFSAGRHRYRGRDPRTTGRCDGTP